MGQTRRRGGANIPRRPLKSTAPKKLYHTPTPDLRGGFLDTFDVPTPRADPSTAPKGEGLRGIVSAFAWRDNGQLRASPRRHVGQGTRRPSQTKGAAMLGGLFFSYGIQREKRGVDIFSMFTHYTPPLFPFWACVGLMRLAAVTQGKLLTYRPRA